MIDALFEDNIKVQLARRIELRMPFAKTLYDKIGSFFVAGNSLNEDTPNDFDVYPTRTGQFDDIRTKIGEDNVVYVTKNATTCNIGGKTVQFCNYFKSPWITDLLKSFDFAHVQVGAQCTKDLSDGIIFVANFTPDWLVAKSTGNTFYTHSDYPISSLIRISKYIKRGNFLGKSYMRDIMMILTDILERGIVDYEDFKDQLDAIDLSMLGEGDVTVAQDLFHAFQHVVPTPTECQP